MRVEGAPVEQERLVLDQMRQLEDQVPIGNVRVQFADGDDAITAYATAQTGDPLVGNQRIHINRSEWIAQLETREGVMGPYLVDADPINGTLVHEYGHLVDASVRRAMHAAGDQTALADWAALHDASGVEWSSLTAPSPYAMENSGEMAAEMFASWWRGGQRAPVFNSADVESVNLYGARLAQYDATLRRWLSGVV